MDTMTIREISRILQITEDTARNRLSMGLAMPPSFRVGRRRLFMRTEVELWLNMQRAAASEVVQPLSGQNALTTAHIPKPHFEKGD